MYTNTNQIRKRKHHENVTRIGVILLTLLMLMTSFSTLTKFPISTSVRADILCNKPPNIPSNPIPANGSINVSTSSNLTWAGGDPNPCDTVTYDVYFGTITPPTTKVSANQSDLFYDPEALSYTTHYYWKIVSWDNHGASTPGPLWSFTTQNENEYTLIITVVGSGSVAKKPDTLTYHYNDVVQLTATADPGWAFNHWAGDFTGTTNPASLTITGNMSVQAFFIQNEYTLTISIIGGGSVIKAPDQLTYYYNDVVQLTASADLGWHFDQWSGDLTGTTNPSTITIDGNKTVTATFIQNEYTLAITLVGLGSVMKTPDNTSYHYDDVVTLNATADPGWSFAGWSGNLSGMINPINLTIDGNKEVTATFTSVSPTNNPPYIPTDPFPSNTATNVSVATHLSWTGGDPDGNNVTYDVYFGTTSPPGVVSANQSATIYSPATMAYNTTYYWMIIAWDNQSAFTAGPQWTFTTEGQHTNHAPNTPTTPRPFDYQTNVSIFEDFSWNGGDPNTNDTVMYDLFFDTASPPAFYNTTIEYPATQTQINYTFPQLQLNTTYYWQILAHDNHNASTSGPVWRFSTIPLGADIQPPSQVTGLTVTDAHDGKLNLEWNNATDNYGVDHYKIYRNNVFLINVTGALYQDIGLTNGQTYTYQVSAVDTSGNEGLLSGPASGRPTKSNQGSGGTGNIPPVADLSAGEPYHGIIGDDIFFNGSRSHDPDGKIVKWFWTFGDGANSTAKNVTHHAYTQTGVFTVTLTVTDNQGASNTKTTTATVLTPNEPPNTPTLEGNTTGKINTSYEYTASSTDPENSSLTYLFDWGDNITSGWIGPFQSGAEVKMNHSWIKPNFYFVSVLVKDNQNSSATTTIMVAISVENVYTIGHLIDHNGDGTYDAFFSNLTKNETAVQKQPNGTYYIDYDGDGDWDYIYNPYTKQLTLFPTPEETTQDNMPWMILGGIIGCIIILFAILLVLTRKKNIPAPPPAQQAQPAQPTQPVPPEPKVAKTNSSTKTKTTPKKPRKTTKK